MRIAVIGGGASGLTTAFLLNKVHDVTLFEKRACLGGNIRTLNKNVASAALPPGVYLDNGVLEFEPEKFPTFTRLMALLGVELNPFPGHSGLFLADGRYLLSPENIESGLPGLLPRLKEFGKLMSLTPDGLAFMARTARLSARDFRDLPVAEFFGDGAYFVWLRLFLTYAYSIPYRHVDQIPAVIAIPMLRQFSLRTKWVSIRGGAYSYVEKILEKASFNVILETRIAGIRREADHVAISLNETETLSFDKLVFATTPDQVLPLLRDPSDAERRRFGAWQGNAATTVIHTDLGVYRPFGVACYSEFDVFHTSPNEGGYNAYLNRIAGLTSVDAPSYCMAYNLDDRIDPATIIDVQEHWTPFYTVDAVRYRDEVAETNGERNTFHAGAYLGNGLHEGAIASALSVSRLLGGGTL